MNALPASERFDEAALLAQLGGDRDLARTIVRSAMEAIPRYFDGLAAAIAAGKWPDAARLAHTMKGLAAQIGAVRLPARLSALARQLRDGGTTDLDTLDELRREYQELAALLETWLG